MPFLSAILPIFRNCEKGSMLPREGRRRRGFVKKIIAFFVHLYFVGRGDMKVKPGFAKISQVQKPQKNGGKKTLPYRVQHINM